MFVSSNRSSCKVPQAKKEKKKWEEIDWKVQSVSITGNIGECLRVLEPGIRKFWESLIWLCLCLPPSCPLSNNVVPPVGLLSVSLTVHGSEWPQFRQPCISSLQVHRLLRRSSFNSQLQERCLIHSAWVKCPLRCNLLKLGEMGCPMIRSPQPGDAESDSQRRVVTKDRHGGSHIRFSLNYIDHLCQEKFRECRHMNKMGEKTITAPLEGISAFWNVSFQMFLLLFKWYF